MKKKNNNVEERKETSPEMLDATSADLVSLGKSGRTRREGGFDPWTIMDTGNWQNKV